MQWWLGSVKELASPSPPCSFAPARTSVGTEPWFSNHAGQAERAELVGDFATAAAAVVATVDVEDIL